MRGLDGDSGGHSLGFHCNICQGNYCTGKRLRGSLRRNRHPDARRAGGHIPLNPQENPPDGRPGSRHRRRRRF
jgi:hypothetical protein